MEPITAQASDMTVKLISTHPNARQPGRATLVGAGPGDPDLLTVKALRTIQTADLILFDRLVSEEIKALFPPSTPAIYVGKAKGLHSIPQDQLTDLLLAKTRQGLHVCRLKGGDSFIFGRGGEEMLVLKQAGIDVAVVPGITSASGCSSYAGIPLTHRGLSQGCTFVTAHGEEELKINWHSLAQSQHTLVFYMGLSRAEMISHSLQAAGMSRETPAALIENGCRSNQRVVTGVVGDLANMAVREQVKSPALILVGDVVSLSGDLSWFDPMALESAQAVDKSQKVDETNFEAVI